MAFTKTSAVALGIQDGQSTGALSASLTETSSGTDWEVRPYTATTSWTAIPLGSLASFDLLCVKNTDGTNYVEIATANDGTGIFGKLTPARFSFIACNPSATYYIRANTASCVVQLSAVEP